MAGAVRPTPSILARVGLFKQTVSSGQAGRGLTHPRPFPLWLDCKTSPVIFNKNTAKFSMILEKIPLTFQKDPRFLKSLDAPFPGEWRFEFSSKEDEDRHIKVHVFAFNLFVKDGKGRIS
jgi:hypothetical protein